MKTKTQQKEFDTVKTFQKIKKDISKKLSDLSTEEIKAFLNENSFFFSKSKVLI